MKGWPANAASKMEASGFAFNGDYHKLKIITRSIY